MSNGMFDRAIKTPKAEKPYFIRATGKFQNANRLEEYALVENGVILAHVGLDLDAGDVARVPDEMSLVGRKVTPILMARFGFRRTAKQSEVVTDACYTIAVEDAPTNGETDEADDGQTADTVEAATPRRRNRRDTSEAALKTEWQELTASEEI